MLWQIFISQYFLDKPLSNIKLIKGLLHPNIKMLSLITYPYVIPNL